MHKVIRNGVDCNIEHTLAQANLNDLIHWMQNSKKTDMAGIAYMMSDLVFNRSMSHLRNFVASSALKRGGKIGSAKSVKEVNNKILDISEKEIGVIGKGKIISTPRHVFFSCVLVTEIKSPGKYRNINGNIYVVRLINGKFGSGNLNWCFALTGHLLERLAERGGNTRMTRTEQINFFIDLVLSCDTKCRINRETSEFNLFIKQENQFLWFPGTYISSKSGTDQTNIYMFCKTVMVNSVHSTKEKDQIKKFRLDQDLWDDEATERDTLIAVRW